MILLGLAPNPSIAVFVDFNVDDVWIATDWAILDVFLTRPCCRIDGHDDFFAAVVADVVRIIIHSRDCIIR